MNNTTRKNLADIKSKIEELAAQADELKNELEALRDDEQGSIDSGKHSLFLSPTIPDGECGCKLVPDYDAIRDAERYRFLRDEENWVDDEPDFAIRPWETLGESSGKEFDSIVDSYMGHRKAMIQAAGVTK